MFFGGYKVNHSHGHGYRKQTEPPGIDEPEFAQRAHSPGLMPEIMPFDVGAVRANRV